jgi:folate-dependent tRNA-U54 methylase TrmFO/GidA
LTNAHGLLKAELELLGSELLGVAQANAIPGGKALVIDRTGTMLQAATDGGGVFDLELSTATPDISVSPAAATIATGASTVLTATIDPPQLTATQLAASSSIVLAGDSDRRLPTSVSS